MPSPATWLAGRGHSHRSPARAPIRSRLARAECSSAPAVSCTPLGAPVEPEVAITTATSGGTPTLPVPAGRSRSVPSGVSTAAGAKAASRASIRSRGSCGSRGRIAGPLPSSAAARASSSRPAYAAGGSRSACRCRSVTVVRLTGRSRDGSGGLSDRVGGARRVQREAPPRHRQIPPAPVTEEPVTGERPAGGDVVASLLPSLRAFAIPMRTRFRGITVREGALIEGPAGWGEFSPFAGYGPRECARWLACAVEAATVGWPAPVRDRVPVNVTVPAVGPAQAHALVAASGCRTAKVKVAERAQSLADDVGRVEAVRD